MKTDQIPQSPAFLTALLFSLAACTTGEDFSPRATFTPIASSSSTPSPPPPATSTAISSATPAATPTRIAPEVNSTTLEGKVIFGYQGWFACPGDVPQFDPYGTFFNGPPILTNLNVDLWPDISELPSDATCATAIRRADGSPLLAFSNYNPLAVDTHFKWMEEYGIDGVALQRFVEGLKRRPIMQFRDGVADNVRRSAERHGRVFFIEYALGGLPNDHIVDDIIRDWQYLVDQKKLTQSPRYLFHNGLPVVGIFGFGFTVLAITPSQASALLDYFQSSAPPQYRAFVMGGVHPHWRFNTDLLPWRDVILRLNVMSPWTVYAYKNGPEADLYARDVMKPDMALASSKGVKYMPVVWPGFSTSNLIKGRPKNEVPRNRGTFYWRQVYNAISMGADMLFVAMFDEVNEGTAMFKLVATRQELPPEDYLLPLDVDGYSIPNDWYLALGRETGKMLRGEILLSPEIPITPRALQR